MEKQNQKNTDLTGHDTKATSQDINSKYLFFNIMPKITKFDQIVKPEIINTQAPENKPVSDGSKNLIIEYKKWLIIGFIIIILGLVGYFVVIKFFGNPYPEENLVVKDSTKTGEPKPTNKPVETALNSKITKDWQKKYFNSEICQSIPVCGDDSDPDRDGLINLDEFKLNTDPNNPDSDLDGLADGDEVKIFKSNPLKVKTSNQSQYSDADYAKGGYSLLTDKQYTKSEIFEIKTNMEQYGIHKPTVSTLGESLIKIYTYNDPLIPTPTPTSTLQSIKDIDQSVEAKQDRDAQRSNAIKNVGIALIKYYDDNKTFPKTLNFFEMFNQVKIYLRVATNPSDPIGKEPYMYKYEFTNEGLDFILSFYSETANQIIKKKAIDAKKDLITQQGEINDNQRKTDLDGIRTALLIYSSTNSAGNQEYVFPAADKYKTAIVPAYLSEIPKDPKTLTDYEYQVNETFDTFTLKATFESPKTGTTGWICNQEECREY